MHGVSRPLSPYITVYRWQITMWLSSLHRITGLLLSLGALALAIWLAALASGSSAYAEVRELYASAGFKVLLVAWTFCFFFHLANGVRHLVWDTGAGFEKAQFRASGWAVIVLAVVATAVFSAVAIF
ncbi:MAG TPA: succinate dehydrogenase, cytochrome b556 subunit [Gammaproteobacteria bacterium]|nr:succinate dehydrogenase, cytochrome b556 subunit [Gammaproteobacteria bacterium]